MKIAQIDVNFRLSSTGKIVSDLVECLGRDGHSTLACFGRGKDPKIEGVHKVSMDLEVGFHALGTRLSGFTGSYSYLATRRLIWLLSEYKPDVVHLHDLHGYFLNIGDLVEFLKITNTPTVWTFHSEFMYTGKCGHAFDCEKWKSHCDRCPTLQSYPASWFFDKTKVMFEQKKLMFDGFKNLYLTAPSQWLASRMGMSPIVGNKLISVIQNGIDVDIFYPRDSIALRKQLGLTDKYIALSVGSNLFSEVKGGQYVLRLAERNPGINFVMIGSGKVSGLIPPNVKILHSLDDQDLLAVYYSMADVLLLTSARETFSMVCAESLACGTPVIGFDSGAPKEVAPPGFGEFVPYGDLDALESMLRRVRLKQLRMNSSQECVAFAVKKYAKEVMVKKFEGIYQEMLEHRSSSREL